MRSLFVWLENRIVDFFMNKIVFVVCQAFLRSPPHFVLKETEIYWEGKVTCTPLLKKKALILIQRFVKLKDFDPSNNYQRFNLFSKHGTIPFQEAEALGKKDEERLLQTRKLSLVVDLDQTLIHTTMELIPQDMEV